MKKNLLRIINILTFTTLLLGNIENASSQNVLIKISGIKDSIETSLDSITIFNESNGSTLKLGRLPQNITDYTVNLTTGSLFTATDIQDISKTDECFIKNTSNGFDLITTLSKNQNLYVSIYSIDGKLIQNNRFFASAGYNSFSIPFLDNGLYIAKVSNGSTFNTFKISRCNFESNSKDYIIRPSKQISSKTMGFANGNFSYLLGDRIQVVVKKGNIKSLTWKGKPINGSSVVVAIPKTGAVFDMAQTISSGAQTFTISFSGVAFYSGCFYASSFYPPGKVADYFGFQYMRDNDADESGHNTDFLTKAAYHMMHILDASQMQVLIDLAVTQEAQFNEYALGRLTLIKAFHNYLDNNLPSGTTALNIDSVRKVSQDLYLIDAEISYTRALKFAEVINSLTEEQRDTLYKLGALGMKRWPMPEKPTISIPRGLNTWVMSNASELFSWFLRDVKADIYFCPERQGTYFGGFYMKDAPAVGTPGYAIDPQATANKGAYMLDKILTTNQANEIKNIYQMTKPDLDSIVVLREKISIELRKALSGQEVNKANILKWSAKYGYFDGNYIYDMVEQFVKVGRTLTSTQLNDLITLRDLAGYPCKPGKVFLFSSEIDEPQIPSTDFLFQ